MSTNIGKPEYMYATFWDEADSIETLNSKEGGERFGGLGYRFKFLNGYSASIVSFPGTYGYFQGLWEIAVFRDGHIVYDTPITDNVIGNVTEQDVIKYLKEIAKLPAKYTEDNDE